MRLLFLIKRRPQQRCLMDRPYGRFFYLPVELAQLGFDVRVILIGHAGDFESTASRSGVTWTTMDVKGTRATGILPKLLNEIRGQQPDWIIGCSDAWVGVIATWLARRSGSRLAIDAYDNYESYMPWNKPLHWAWRRAIRAADLSLAAGPQLAQLMDRERTGRASTCVIPMAADPYFVPLNQSVCRERLGLPLDVPTIGYSGGWSKKRGTDILPKAFQELRNFVPEAILALTGRPPNGVQNIAGVVTLGYLDDAMMPVFINALDVSTVITTNSPFGQYSYPSKLCEALACNVPIVASATEPVRWMLQGEEHALVPVEDMMALAEGLRAALSTPRQHRIQCPSWGKSAAHLSEALSGFGMAPSS